MRSVQKYFKMSHFLTKVISDAYQYGLMLMASVLVSEQEMLYHAVSNLLCLAPESLSDRSNISQQL